MRLEDKVILVTASTRGIGAAIVRACAEEDAVVYMAARRVEAAQQMADELNANGARVHVVYNDAYKKDTYVSMIDEVVEKEGHIDGLVNNFGTSNPKVDLDIQNTSYDEFIKTLDANLGSVFISSQAAIKHMTKTGGGSIVNISSVGGLVPDVSQIAYGTSKAAINYLTKLIAVQAGRAGVRCNVVAPGMTATDAVMDNLTPEFMEFFQRHIPIKRMGKPEEIAHAVVYLLSDEACYTTGQIIAVTGGFGMATPVFADLADSATKR
ncbi:MAG: SDR family NAD(P)-dependent oxidoreductase [Atopobiaceae bacterium]|jgi:NAD(P)-dependent dehydrogenase (short-subunit alcohol dehydrogenase family)